MEPLHQLWTLDFLFSEENKQFICQAPVNCVSFRMHSSLICSVSNIQNKDKNSTHYQGEAKLSLFALNMVLYVENLNIP